VPRAPAAWLPDWWPGNEDPLVYLTFGSVAASLGYFPGLYRAACDALAELPVRVLLTVGADADLAPLPANVHSEPWLAQERILPHANAVVSHGGHGTLLGALAHGLPQVVLPLFGADQREHARRVAALGAGVALDGARATMFEHPRVDGLADAVARVLDDPGYRAAAWRVATEIEALPPVAAVPDVLHEVIA
jgi:UDP:flavonoid glycosyltransferase YjiC (YdhE family)